jgi:hypothetical protein
MNVGAQVTAYANGRWLGKAAARLYLTPRNRAA